MAIDKNAARNPSQVHLTTPTALYHSAQGRRLWEATLGHVRHILINIEKVAAEKRCYVQNMPPLTGLEKFIGAIYYKYVAPTALKTLALASQWHYSQAR